MDRTLTHRLAALLVAVVVAAGLAWTTGVAPLAGAAGLCWGVAVGVAFRARRLRPGVPNDDGWTDARWTGLAVGLVTLAATFGVAPALALSSPRRLGLVALVLGVGFVGYATATMVEIERHPDFEAQGRRGPTVERVPEGDRRAHRGDGGE